MKRLLVVIAAFVAMIAFVLWIASWFRNDEAVAVSASRPWPGDLGPLERAAARWPQLEANEASRRLTALADPLRENETIGEFVTREIARGELAIGAPPALPDLSRIRELLLREEVVWDREEGVGGGDPANARRATVMIVGRALVASALARGRTGDPAAWDDLHAAWKLARSLDAHPQMMFQTAVLSVTRMINAAAWRMPMPPPPWFAELQGRDGVRPLLASFHYQAASYWQSGAQMFPTKSLADSVEKDRRIAEALFNEKRCDVTTVMNDLGTDLSSVWRRAFRYRAEQEATANALRVRKGEPIETTSRCSDGTWSFDGTTLRFSQPIATAPPDRPMPLVLKVKP